MKSGFSHLTKLFCVVLVVALPVQSVMHSYLSLPIVESTQAQAMASKTNKFNNPQHFSNRNIAGKTIDQFFADEVKNARATIHVLKKIEKKAEKRFHKRVVFALLPSFGLLLSSFALGLFFPYELSRLGQDMFVPTLMLTSLAGIYAGYFGRIAHRAREQIKNTKTTDHRDHLKYYMQFFDKHDENVVKDYQTIKTTTNPEIENSINKDEKLKSILKVSKLLQKRYSKFQHTATHFAVAYNDEKFFEKMRNFYYDNWNSDVKYIYRYFDDQDLFNQPDALGVRPVDMALKMGHIEVLKHLLPETNEKFFKDGENEAEKHKSKIARKLREDLQSRVKQYVNRLINDIPRVLSNIEKTGIHSAGVGVRYDTPTSTKTFDHLALSIMKGELTAAQLDQALQEGFNINTVDLHDNTLLHIAMGSENMEAVILLLARRAGTKIENSHKVTFYGLLDYTMQTLKNLVKFKLLTECNRRDNGFLIENNGFVIEEDHILVEDVRRLLDRYEMFKQGYKPCPELLTAQ